MNETKICRACGLEKSVKSFPKANQSTGYASRCKVCKLKGNLIPKVKIKTKKSIAEQRFEDIVRLDAPNAEDYKLMYDFLKSIGYDVTKDVHKQFCKKYKLVYKKRANQNLNSYLYDGSFNKENSRAIYSQQYLKLKKNTPPINDEVL